MLLASLDGKIDAQSGRRQCQQEGPDHSGHSQKAKGSNYESCVAILFNTGVLAVPRYSFEVYEPSPVLTLTHIRY